MRSERTKISIQLHANVTAQPEATRERGDSPFDSDEVLPHPNGHDLVAQRLIQTARDGVRAKDVQLEDRSALAPHVVLRGSHRAPPKAFPSKLFVDHDVVHVPQASGVLL